jgi:hypothetical protein
MPAAKTTTATSRTTKTPAPRPGYTDEQLQKGRTARLDGGTWTAVAASAGVKAESHFSKVLREPLPELTAPAKKPAPAKAKPAAKKPASRTGKTATAKK